MNITACSQLKSRIWPYFQLNSEILQLLTEEGNDFWFELSGGSRNGDSTVWSPLCVLSDFFGERAVERKIMQQQLCVNKQSCKVEQGLHLQGMSFSDLTAFLYMPLDTPLLHVLCCHLLQPLHKRASWCLLTILLLSKLRVTIFLQFKQTNDELVFWVAFIGRPLLSKAISKCLLFHWLILGLFTYFLKIIHLLLWNTKRKT